MQDLNDFAWFVQVVDHGGFAAAGRALDQPKSKLSRRIAQLEERLGVRLIQRTTRQFAVTEVGQTFYQHCKAMLIEAEAAQQAVETLRAEPRGSVRITCPVTLLHVHIGPMLARFMARYPGVTLHLEATNRRVDVVGEGIDVAIRVRPRPIEDSDLVMRVLADRGHRLVASPDLISRLGRPQAPSELSAWPDLISRLGRPQAPSELSAWPGLSLGANKHQHKWQLTGPGGARAEVYFTPRMVTTDMLALREAAMAGVGVVQLPLLMVRDQLASGKLEVVLDEWQPRREVIHAVFASRRGLLPSVRALVDYLSEEYQRMEED
ncbi:TPA: LysR family transcriptional regulator [Klebsiella pneumoniae]|nr:LysR family transcriptional regulator [Klebsiella pneumoniae]